jgi:glycerophosphoryl diester phosphodiesterase
VRKANILAHRGLWRDPADRNSRAALCAAIERGFGIETDFRDSGGELWVSHDPAIGNCAIAASRFFKDYASLGGVGRLALNIKSDGLQGMVADALGVAGIPFEQVFAFDMSVPDALGYIRSDLPIYSRISEHEPEPPFADVAVGVWVDNFTGKFPQVARSAALLASGHRVAIVSPELHGRPYDALWKGILDNGLHLHPAFELCTDFPKEAHRMLGTD